MAPLIKDLFNLPAVVCVYFVEIANHTTRFLGVGDCILPTCLENFCTLDMSTSQYVPE
jgi:hypothetical protein